MIEILAELTDEEAIIARQLPRVVYRNEGLAALLNLIVRADGRICRLGDARHPNGQPWRDYLIDHRVDT